jgi:lipid kinase YegS
MRLIVNGKAAGNLELRAAVTQLRNQGHTLEVRVTWEVGDAARLAQEALQDNVDVVIAVGGDGTINEVVTGLLQSSNKASVAIGVVPFGTANDFANGCGIPIGDPLAALQLIASTDPVPIDVACCNDRYFVNVASGGFGAEVTANTPPEMKRALGGAAYSLMALATAMKMSPYHARVTTPDGEDHQGQLFVVAVGNGRQAGGGFQVAPDAVLDDGLLDVMGIVDVEVTQLGTVFAELANMTAPGNKYVKYAKLSAFRIESDEPLQMNLDGEPMRDTTFEFRVIPRALRFILPPEAPLNG